jgi:hypothetical protein
MRNIDRRLARLETRHATVARRPLSVRIHYVDPEKGLVSVLLVESGKTTEVPTTIEDEEQFRESQLRRVRPEPCR